MSSWFTRVNNHKFWRSERDVGVAQDHVLHNSSIDDVYTQTEVCGSVILSTAINLWCPHKLRERISFLLVLIYY